MRTTSASWDVPSAMLEVLFPAKIATAMFTEPYVNFNILRGSHLKSDILLRTPTVKT
jgi:hypothetical protein